MLNVIQPEAELTGICKSTSGEAVKQMVDVANPSKKKMREWVSQVIWESLFQNILSIH